MPSDLKDATIWNLRGVTRYNLQDFDGAIVDYSKAIELDIENPTYYDNRALCREQKQDFAGAVEDYSMSIDLFPTDPETFLSRGKVKIRMNNTYDGCLDLKRAEEMGSADARAIIRKQCK